MQAAPDAIPCDPAKKTDLAKSSFPDSGNLLHHLTHCKLPISYAFIHFLGTAVALQVAPDAIPCDPAKKTDLAKSSFPDSGNLLHRLTNCKLPISYAFIHFLGTAVALQAAPDAITCDPAKKTNLAKSSFPESGNLLHHLTNCKLPFLFHLFCSLSRYRSISAGCS